MTRTDKHALAERVSLTLCDIANDFDAAVDGDPDARKRLVEFGYSRLCNLLSLSPLELDKFLRDCCPRCDGDSADGNTCEECRAELAKPVVAEAL